MSGEPEGVIQPTMRRTVAMVRKHGFETTDSGDGVINVEAGMEGALPIPHVFARTRPETMVADARRLWATVCMLGLDQLGARVETSYSPGDGVAVLALYEVTDATFDRIPEARIVELQELIATVGFLPI